MRITVWGINYTPELTGIAPYNRALCEHLAGLGHEVRMVTTFPYYPAWKKAAADRGKLLRTEIINAVQVYRCWHYVPRRVTTLKRVLHEATFVATTLGRLLFLPRPDLYVIVSPPLLLGLAARILRTFRPAPYVFHVQDLQPDAALGLGMLQPSALTRLLYRLETMAYQHSAAVSGISQGMLEAFTRKGVPTARQIYFPNGANLPGNGTPRPRGEFRTRQGIKPQEFLAVYSGNLGVKQGLEILLDAAKLLHDSDVRIVVCGDGAVRQRLEAAIRQDQLRNFTLLPLQTDKDYQEMLMDADVCLVTQQAGSGAAFLPSKLLATLALGRPVVGVADQTSELRRAIAAGEFGRCVQPGEADQLAGVLRAFASDRAPLAQYGTNGRQYVEQFAFDRVLPRFAADLERFATRHPDHADIRAPALAAVGSWQDIAPEPAIGGARLNVQEPMEACLITGGTGYIGSKWAERLLRRQKFKRVILADIRPPSEPLTNGMEFIHCDVRKPLCLDGMRPQWVFNFAGVHREPGHAPEEYFDTNVSGARNICAFAERLDCRNILFTSSIAVYGPSLQPVGETSALYPSTPYGMSKLWAELIHEEWQHADQTRRLCVCRPGVVYGPGDPGNILRMIRAVRKGYFMFPGSKHLRKSYAYIEGLLDSFEFMMSRRDARLTYNYVERETETLATLVRIVQAHLGRRGPTFTAPLPILEAVATLAQWVTRGRSPLHPMRVRKTAMSTHIIPEMLSKLGFAFRYDFPGSLRDWARKAPHDFA